MKTTVILVHNIVTITDCDITASDIITGNHLIKSMILQVKVRQRQEREHNARKLRLRYTRHRM